MKKVGIIGILVCCICLVTGCTKQKNREELLQEDKKERKESIVLWSYYETNAQRVSLDKLIKQFNQSQDKYEARWEYVPMTEFTKRLSIGVMDNDLPDIVLIDNPDMSTYVRLEMFEELTPYIDLWENGEEYYEELWKTIQYEGKYYGIPFSCNNVALIYNKEMFEEVNLSPPSNWEEFLKAAEMLTTKEHYGFVMSGVEGEQSAFQILPWILSAGESMDSLGSKKTEKAFSLIETMSKNGYMDINCVSWSQTDIARKFVAGEAAMMENGPWILPMLKEVGISYGVIPLPSLEESIVITGGENLAILKGKNVEGAVEFLRYYNQKHIMTQVCKEANAIPPKRKEANDMLQSNPEYKVFVEQMETAISRVNFENWTQVSKRLSEALYYVITGEKTAERAADYIKKGVIN